jgi:hypothetical protein
MQQRLKSAPGPARATIIAPEFLEQFLAAAHYSVASLDVRFGGEALPTFASNLESSRLRGGVCSCARDTFDRLVTGDAHRSDVAHGLPQSFDKTIGVAA